MTEESGTRTLFRWLIDAWNNRNKNKGPYFEPVSDPSPVHEIIPKTVIKHGKFSGNITYLKKSKEFFDDSPPKARTWHGTIIDD